MTKDKRSSSSYWRRIACWGCGLVVLAIAVIIAILAATGVILTQEATQPLKNDVHTSSHQFGNVQAPGSQEYMKNPPTSPPPETSSFPLWPTTDESLYQTVPKALDGIIELDNLQWIEELNDPKSRTYREVTSEIESNLKDMLHVIDNLSVVKVYEVSKDGEVKFRVSYPPMPTAEQTQTNVEKLLQKNGNMIGQYHLRRLSVKRLIDNCQHGNLKCSESCRYDYSEGLFICTCFPGRVLDKTEKTCKNENDLSNVDMDKVLPEPSTESIQNGVQSRSRGPETVFYPRQPEYWGHKHSEFVTEFNIVPENELKHVDTQSESPVKPVSELESMVKSTIDDKIKSESSLEPKLESEPTIESSIESRLEPESSTEPKSDPESRVKSSTEPELKSEPSSDPEPTVESSAEPKVAPESSSKPNSGPEPTVESLAERKVEPDSEPTPEPEFFERLQLTHKYSETTAEPKVEPEPSTESKSEPEFYEHPQWIHEHFGIRTEPNIVPEHDDQPESNEESKFESKSSDELKAGSKLHEQLHWNDEHSGFITEHGAVTENNGQPESFTEPTFEHESSIKSRTDQKFPDHSFWDHEHTGLITEPNTVSEDDVLSEILTEPKFESESSTESRFEHEIPAEPKFQELSIEPKFKLESSPKSEFEHELITKPNFVIKLNFEPELTTESKFEFESSTEFEFKYEDSVEHTFKSKSPTESLGEHLGSSSKPESESELSVVPESDEALVKIPERHNNGVILTTKPNSEIPEITRKDEGPKSVTPLSSIEITTDEQSPNQTPAVLPTIELQKSNIQAKPSSINYKKHEHEIIRVANIDPTIEPKLEAYTKDPSSGMESTVVPTVRPIFESKINDNFERPTELHVTRGESSPDFKPQMVPIPKSQSEAVTESLNKLKLSSMEDTKIEVIPMFISSTEPSNESNLELKSSSEQKFDLKMTSTLKSEVELTEESISESMSSIQTEMKVKSSEKSDLESDSTTGPQSDSISAVELKSGSELNVKVNPKHELTTAALIPEPTVNETPELVSTKEKSESESTVEPKSRVNQNWGSSFEFSNESTARMPQFKLTSEPTTELTLLSKDENLNMFVSAIPEVKTRITNESNVIDHMPTTVFPKLPKNIGQNVGPLIDTDSEDEHIMVIPNVKHSTEIYGAHAIIPELIPEQSKDRHSMERISKEPEKKRTSQNVHPAVGNNHSADSFIRVTETEIIGEYTTFNSVHSSHPEEFLEHSTNHPLYPMVFPDNPVERSTEKLDVSEEKQTENMSPFLPDVHREKETLKKAPRLDKDEQDVPNPFETYVEDVIMDHSNREKNETKSKNDVNETKITGWSNKEHEHRVIHNLDSVTGDESNNRTLKGRNYSIDDNMKLNAFLGFAINNDKDTAENGPKTEFNKTSVTNETPQHINNADVQLHDALNISEIINHTESSIHNGLNGRDIQKGDLKQRIDNSKYILNNNNNNRQKIK